MYGLGRFSLLSRQAKCHYPGRVAGLVPPLLANRPCGVSTWTGPAHRQLPGSHRSIRRED